MHPFIRKRLLIEEEYKDRIIEFSYYPDINQLFYVTEILITDYSSNIYEFSLQKKPIISFAYDKAEYELIRSVHRTLDKYAPGKVCTTLDEVVDTIKKKDFEKANANIKKAQAIINELRVTLDHKYSVWEDFERVYDYIARRLLDANLQKDIEIIEDALKYIREMRDAWKEVMRLNSAK